MNHPAGVTMEVADNVHVALAPIVLPFNNIKDPASAAVDGKGNVYLNDGLHFRILKLSVQ